MVAENGRLAALSRERVLNRNLGQQKKMRTANCQQITDLMSDDPFRVKLAPRLSKIIVVQSVRTGKTEHVTEGKTETVRTGKLTINKL